MSLHPCCRRFESETPLAATTTHRALNSAGWIIPGALLMMMPKCPFCVAGYVTLATGVGLSFTTAAYFRSALIALCIFALLAMATRTLIRVHQSRKRRLA